MRSPTNLRLEERSRPGGLYTECCPEHSIILEQLPRAPRQTPSKSTRVGLESVVMPITLVKTSTLLIPDIKDCCKDVAKRE